MWKSLCTEIILDLYVNYSKMLIKSQVTTLSVIYVTTSNYVPVINVGFGYYCKAVEYSQIRVYKVQYLVFQTMSSLIAI